MSALDLINRANNAHAGTPKINGARIKAAMNAGHRMAVGSVDIWVIATPLNRKSCPMSTRATDTHFS